MELTVEDLVRIQLPDGRHSRPGAMLAALPRVAVDVGDRLTITAGATTLPLEIVPASRAALPARQKVEDAVGEALPLVLVVAERLATSARDALEHGGHSYVDGTGAAHIEIPGFVLHYDQAAKAPRTSAPPPGLGVVAVRLIQLLLAEPDRDWRVIDLAASARSSTGQAHNVLRRLETEGLVDARGTGPTMRRTVTEPTAMLDWLARIPAARRLHATIGAYLYAPDPDALIERLARSAREAGITWALTGAAGARAEGFTTMTALPVAMVRTPTPSGPALGDVLKLFGAEPAASGGNLMIVRDVGDVGTHHASRNGDAIVAPPVRLWLDMLSERRGEDAADQFRETVLGF